MLASPVGLQDSKVPPGTYPEPYLNTFIIPLGCAHVLSLLPTYTSTHGRPHWPAHEPAHRAARHGKHHARLAMRP